MSYFDYQVLDAKTSELLRPKGLSLVVVSIAAMNVIREQAKLEATPNNNKHVNYADTTRSIIKGILTGDSFADKQAEVEPILSEVLGAIEVAEELAKKNEDLGTHTHKNIGAINDFYQSLTSTLTEKVEVVKDEYKPISASDNTMRHEFVVKITHDGNEWLYKMIDIASAAARDEVSVNGIDLDVPATTDKISDDARWHAFLFAPLAMQMAYAVHIDHQIKNLLGNPDIVRKSKAIADVLGGEVENCLIMVEGLDKHIKQYIASGKLEADDTSVEGIINYVLSSRTNITEEQIKEIAGLFESQPIYH